MRNNTAANTKTTNTTVNTLQIFAYITPHSFYGKLTDARAMLDPQYFQINRYEFFYDEPEI